MFREGDHGKDRDHELRNAITDRNGVGSRRIVINQDHLDLAAIARVDQAGCIEHRQAGLECKSRAWQDQRGHAVRQRNGEPTTDSLSLAWRERRWLGRVEIKASIIGVCSLGQSRGVMKPLPGDLGHTGTVGGTAKRA